MGVAFDANHSIRDGPISQTDGDREAGSLSKGILQP